jgi:hypothetical protein
MKGAAFGQYRGKKNIKKKFLVWEFSNEGQEEGILHLIWGKHVK